MVRGDASALAELLTPVKPQIVVVHVRMFVRFLEFVHSAKGKLESDRILDSAEVFEWFKLPKRLTVGARTLMADLQAIAYHGRIVQCKGLISLAFIPLLQKVAREGKLEKGKEVSRADMLLFHVWNGWSLWCKKRSALSPTD